MKRFELAIGVAVFVVFSMGLTGQVASLPATRPAVGGEAQAILKKVKAKYAAMKSYSAAGETVSEIDRSTMDLDRTPGMTPERKKMMEQSGQLKGVQRLTSTFTIKLGRPDLYRIEWQQKVHATFSNSGVVWSAGEGNFISMPGSLGTKKIEDQMIALAMATGVSGGVANTIPAIFFDMPSNMTNVLSEPTLANLEPQKSEVIDGDRCFIISGVLAGQKIMLWISRKDLLIRQKTFFLGGNLSFPKAVTTMPQEELRKTLKAMGRTPTTQAVEELKKQMERATTMTSKVKGSMTETYRNIVVDAPVDKKDFVPRPGMTKPAVDDGSTGSVRPLSHDIPG